VNSGQRTDKVHLDNLHIYLIYFYRQALAYFTLGNLPCEAPPLVPAFEPLVLLYLSIHGGSLSKGASPYLTGGLPTGKSLAQESLSHMVKFYSNRHGQEQFATIDDEDVARKERYVHMGLQDLRSLCKT